MSDHTVPWRAKPGLSLLVGVSEVARLLAIDNSAVVTNWRTRHGDFPPDRTGGAQPRFDLVDVLEWVCHSGPRRADGIAVVPSRWWEKLVHAFEAQAPLARPRNAMVALVLMHHLVRTEPVTNGVTNGVTDAATDPGGRWSDPWQTLVDVVLAPRRSADDIDRSARVAAALVSVATRIEIDRPDLHGLLVPQLDLSADAATFLADLIDAIDLSDRSGLDAEALLRPILHADGEARGRALHTTNAFVADLLVALADVRPGDTVLDPAAGEGTLLLTAARRSAREGGPAAGSGVTLLGQEIDEHAWLIARSRMEIAGVTADLARPGLDSLRTDQHAGPHGERLVDVVVLDPPVGDEVPSLGRWIVHARGHLTSEGRLVILLPLHALVEVKAARRSPDGRLVALVGGLIADGCVDGAVMVPRGLRSDVLGPVIAMVIAPEHASIERRTRNRQVTVAALMVAPKDPSFAPLRAIVVDHLTQGGVASLTGIAEGVVVRTVEGATALFDAAREIGATVESSTARGRGRPVRTTRPSDVASPLEDILARLQQVRRDRGEAAYRDLVASLVRVLDAPSPDR